MSDKPPERWLHNEKLAKEWLAKNKVGPLVPSVTKQVPTIPVNRRALSQFGYNPSIIQWRGRFLMAYRWHIQQNLSTSLAMAELDAKGDIIGDRQIELPGTSTEDPKLFVYQTDLYMSWVESNWPSMPPRSVVKYGKLVEGKPWTVPEAFQIKYGKNDGNAMEKNWIFFVAEQGLYCIYQSRPQVVIQVEGDKVVQEWKSSGCRWPWGPIKGGTVPVPYQGNLLRFAHSTLDNEPPPHPRRYYLLAMLMNPEPPFDVDRISQEPIVRGSEVDELPDMERRSVLQYKPQVIFPGGCLPMHGGFLVACGINDSQCAILKLSEEHLKL